MFSVYAMIKKCEFRTVKNVLQFFLNPLNANIEMFAGIMEAASKRFYVNFVRLLYT